ncbi:MAG: hypothetical protein KF773_28015 [Deltaproteobacteria bacterium]|nr:hypothetical protein [Deltaproteobacteria bacterium]
MRTQLALIAAIVAGVASTSTARAERTAWESGVGLWIGSVNISRQRTPEADNVLGVGAHLELGARRGRWLLATELGFLSAQDPAGMMAIPDDARPGALVARAGVAARYSFKQVRSATSVLGAGGDLWLDFGAGVQQVRRSDGDQHVFSRGDVKLGLGGEFNMRRDRRPRFHLGYYYALTVLLTRVDVPAHHPATCVGPCDSATRPIPIEETFLFNVGITFGG